MRDRMEKVSGALAALEAGDSGPALAVLREILEEMVDARCEP